MICLLLRRLFYLVSLFLILVPRVYATNDFSLGVYYFPGWKNHAMAGPYPLPWDKIKSFPALKPLLGWYQEGSVSVMSQQLQWMAKHNINYVVFDMIWGRNTETYLDHAVNAYLRSKDKSDIKFSILWANHTNYIFSKDKLSRIVRIWCNEYFSRPEYLQLDGKPVVFIFSARILNQNIEKIGMKPAEFFAHANQIARSLGLKGIVFIGGVSAADPAMDYSTASGYSGFTAYNYHSPVSYRLPQQSNMSHNYTELDAAYRDHWQWMLNHASGSFIVPLTSGWSKTPWGGSADPAHDQSISTPAEFAQHLKAAKTLMQANADRTRKMAVICCWNEYGEGSYIEPTQSTSFSYLETIRDIFTRE